MSMPTEAPSVQRAIVRQTRAYLAMADLREAQQWLDLAVEDAREGNTLAHSISTQHAQMCIDRMNGRFRQPTGYEVMMQAGQALHDEIASYKRSRLRQTVEVGGDHAE